MDNNLPRGLPIDFNDEKCLICNSVTNCEHDKLSLEEIRNEIEAKKEKESGIYNQ